MADAPGGTRGLSPALEAGQPIRLQWGEGRTLPGRVLRAGSQLVVLEGELPSTIVPGAILTLCPEGDRSLSVPGRLARAGRQNRYLITLGDRPIRRTHRWLVDLRGTIRVAGAAGPAPVRIVDLSESGARLQGLALTVGAEVTLDFVPPGLGAPVSVRVAVVRGVDGAEPPEIGVAFLMATLPVAQTAAPMALEAGPAGPYGPVPRTLQQLREERGWSQYDLALQLGVTAAMVHDWERGAFEPTASTLRRMAHLFGVTMEEITLPTRSRVA